MDDALPWTLTCPPAVARRTPALISQPSGSRLLVSVRTPDEAAAALAGGADLIDVKEPARGPLGMADIDTISRITQTVQDASPSVPVSAALGETLEWSRGRAIPRLPPGLAFVKLGLQGLLEIPDWRAVWQQVRHCFEQACDAPLPWIAVAYADADAAVAPPIDEVLQAAVEAGCHGLLIDTWNKENGGLTNHLPSGDLRALVKEARRRGLLIALAGRIQPEEVPAVAALRPDVIGVRSAACAGGDRRQAIDAAKVAALRSATRISRDPMHARVDEAAAYIQKRWPRRPIAGIILGTGLGRIAEEIAAEAILTYDDIPHFPCSTAMSHAGRLTCGLLRGRPVIAMQGRCHLYEGYTAAEITLPVRAMHQLGINQLIVSNAGGGLNPRLAVGDLVLIDDHFNLTFTRPAVGQPRDVRAPLNPEAVYDRELIAAAERVAEREDFAAHRGTYAAVTGPNYETRAEYRFFRDMGADVIGMSTVPEATVAAELGLRVLAVSTVTNVCNPDALSETDGASVAAAAASAEWKLRRIVLSVLTEAD